MNDVLRGFKEKVLAFKQQQERYSTIHTTRHLILGVWKCTVWTRYRPDQGAFTNDVRRIWRILDPLPPLSKNVRLLSDPSARNIFPIGNPTRDHVFLCVSLCSLVFLLLFVCFFPAVFFSIRFLYYQYKNEGSRENSYTRENAIWKFLYQGFGGKMLIELLFCMISVYFRLEIDLRQRENYV